MQVIIIAVIGTSPEHNFMLKYKKHPERIVNCRTGLVIKNVVMKREDDNSNDL